MRDLVLLMGISIDGNVSGGPWEDIGAGAAKHPDVVARQMAWVSHAGLRAMGRVTYLEMAGCWPRSTALSGERRLVLAEVRPHPDGAVISSYRRPR